MTNDELARIRQWCDAKIPTVTDPHVLAETIKLRDAVALIEANGRLGRKARHRFKVWPRVGAGLGGG
jgi:hypothetical protein